jgi:hypothetical protein
MVVLHRRHPHDGRQIGSLHVAQNILDGFEAEPRMLGVEQREVAASAFQDLPDARGREFDDKVTDLHITRLSHRFQAGGCHQILLPMRLLVARPSEQTTAEMDATTSMLSGIIVDIPESIATSPCPGAQHAWSSALCLN